MKSNKKIASLTFIGLLCAPVVAAVATPIYNTLNKSVALDTTALEILVPTQNYNVQDKSDLFIAVDYNDDVLRDVLDVDGNKLTRTQDYLYDETSLVIRRKYLETLDIGTHSFTLQGIIGSANFTIIVKNGQDVPSAIGDPEIKGSTVYNKNSLANLKLSVDYKGGKLEKVTTGNQVLIKGEEYFYNSTTLEFVNLYLDSLDIGDHHFTLETSGNHSVIFTITVQEEIPVVVYEPPVLPVNSLTYYKASNEDFSFVVDFKNSSLVSVKNGVNDITTYASVKNNKITIAKDYLKGLVEDNYSILIYTEATNPATLTLTVIDEEQTRDSGEAPTIKGGTSAFTYKLGGSGDIAVEVDFKGEILTKVTRDNVLLVYGKDYLLNNSVITITNELLEKMKASSTPYTYKVFTRSGDVTFTIKIDNEETAGLIDLWTDNFPCYTYSYAPLEEGVMPLGGYIEPQYQLGCNTNDQYRVVKESGLNTIYALEANASGATPLIMQEIYNALEFASENGLAYMVRDKGISALVDNETELRKEVSKFDGYDSFGGFFAFDEPQYEKFGPLAETIPVMNELYPEYNVYYNLLPSHGTLSSTGASVTYDEYVSKFINDVQPRYVSYDFYPIANTATNTITQNNNLHFYHLYTIGAHANANQIPFWSFICSTKHWAVPVDITESYLNWQINTALAYGAKGINYFTYQVPFQNGQGEDWMGAESYGTAFVRHNGEKTAVYGYAQKINQQIASMDHVLMNSSVQRKFVYGSSPDKIFGDNAKSAWRELDSVTTSSNLIVSCLDNHNKSAFYIMNNCMNAGASFTLNFNKNLSGKVYAYGAYNATNPNANVTTFTNKTSLTLSLGESQGVLVEITNYKRAA